MTGTEFYFMFLPLGRERLPEGEEGRQVCSGEDEGLEGLAPEWLPWKWREVGSPRI